MVLPLADMLAVVTDLGDVGVIIAMADAIAAAMAACADSLWLCSKELVGPDPPVAPVLLATLAPMPPAATVSSNTPVGSSSSLRLSRIPLDDTLLI